MECPKCGNNVVTVASVDDREDGEEAVYTYFISCEDCGYWFEAFSIGPIEGHLYFPKNEDIIEKK